jgi:hypothetical protein
MINLTTNRIESLPVQPATAWLLGECMQPRGREEMWMRHRLEVLEALHEQATIQSAESSNRIENEIIEILPNGERRVRFVPASAKDTPRAVQALCEAYQRACAVEKLPVLPLIATCVFDLLCIHPFRDGNGRVSRLLTTFLLVQEGFFVCRHISLERLVEDRKEKYFSALAQCSIGWHEGRNDIDVWWNYFLSIVRQAYGEFAQKVENASGRPTKSDLLRRTIMDQVGPFSLSEILATVHAASPQLAKKVLLSMKQKGTVSLTGRGRGALWEVTRDEPERV